MLRVLDPGAKLCDGLTRREWLRVGGVGLGGLSLAGLMSGRTAAAVDNSRGRSFGRAKSVIVLGLLGGPPQQETWDPKPDSPAEARGEFTAIPTSVPGTRVGELMPRTARLVHHIAVLRAMVTGDNAHSSSGYYMLTGVPHQPTNVENVTAKAPNYWPSVAGIVRSLRRDGGRLPAAITVPEHIWNDGNIPWPGQDAGFLGKRANPWLIQCDPAAADFRVPDVALPDDVPPLRFDSRRGLLSQLNEHLDGAQRSRAGDDYGALSGQVLDLVSSPVARRAFDLDKGPPAVRDRYGRTRFGQSCLLARRLVESGVALVQVNWTRIKDQPNQGMWDTHSKNGEALKSCLMPIMDQAYSALLEDLLQRGLLDETLVVWMGEFGRTPKFNAAAGRDHWGYVFSVALAGGGVRGGVVHGASDRIAAHPADGATTPADLSATVFHCLGIDPETEMLDPLSRPFSISRGRVIEAVV